MALVRVSDLTGQRRLLVTRESARLIGESLCSAVSPEDRELVLDFAGVEGLTPSFLDELLGVVGDLQAAADLALEIVLVHPPTRLSSKFAAVGRGRGYLVTEVGGDQWVLKPAA